MARRCRIAVPLAAMLLGAFGWLPQAAADDPSADYSGSLWDREDLLGPIGGLRPILDDAGIAFNLTDTETLFGNTTGGTRRSLAFQGLVTAELELDTEKAFGWKGGTFRISGEQLHGVGLSELSIQNLNTITGTEDPAQTSLYELWYDQKLGIADIRIGRQVASTAFLLDRFEDDFINSAFGWPTLNAEDLPSGAPDYPYAFTGIKLALHLSKSLVWSTGVYDSNTEGDGFSFRGGVFAISEIDYNYGQEKGGGILPGTIKLGALFDSNAFPDQRLDINGLPLGDPASSGDPLLRRGDEAGYVSFDQLVWRQEGRQDASTIGIFGRAMIAPGDRNAVDLFADGGMALTGLLPGRKSDIIDAGLGYARISPSRRGLATDTRRYTGGPYPIPTAETFIELGYRIEVAPWWHVQPDFQYIFNPGGGIPDEGPQHRKIPNAAVFGVKSEVKF